MGFKEIEVGFPAACQPDFDFVRQLIEEDLIPDDVTIQVLVQCRQELIERTYECIAGCAAGDRPLLQLDLRRCSARSCSAWTRPASSTSPSTRPRLCRKLEETIPETDVRYEYSPESFTRHRARVRRGDLRGGDGRHRADAGAPADPQPAGHRRVLHAEHLRRRDRVVLPHDPQPRHRCVLSLHPHNDRGTRASPPPSSAIMAGADRVEGTLFGNGERTGNVDVVNVAMNLFSQGVDPELDITDIDALRRVAEYCNRLPVHPRHPYVGDLVYTAVLRHPPGRDQEGVRGAAAPTTTAWEVPYLPIDPKHVGRTYEAIIRVNSQSGKGGVAYVMKAEHGFDLPRRLQIEFSKTIQHITEDSGTEISPVAMWDAFQAEYLAGRAALHAEQPRAAQRRHRAHGDHGPARRRRCATARSPAPATARSTRSCTRSPTASTPGIDVLDYAEHAIGSGADASAVAYVETREPGGCRRPRQVGRRDRPQHHHRLAARRARRGRAPAALTSSARGPVTSAAERCAPGRHRPRRWSPSRARAVAPRSARAHGRRGRRGRGAAVRVGASSKRPSASTFVRGDSIPRLARTCAPCQLNVRTRSRRALIPPVVPALSTRTGLP